MAFTIYQSIDSGAPTLNGQTGSLLTVLDACLVNGYGAKSAAGWSKPFPNTASYGMYKQGSGSVSCSLFVYDAGSGSASGAEATISGWDAITSIEAGEPTGSNQFPLLVQSPIHGGSLVVRKSTAPTSTARTWVIFADSRTMYGFVKTADVGQSYYAFAFGDFYSLRSGSVDTSRCMIIGRSVVSSSLVTSDKLDVLAALGTVTAGQFIAHFASGTSGSVPFCKHGDGIKGSSTALTGTVQFLNTVDNGLYISPIWISEYLTNTIRGRFRGFYQICHASASFSDGQTFTGSMDFPNRTFQVVTPSANAGAYLIETSDTLETN